MNRPLPPEWQSLGSIASRVLANATERRDAIAAEARREADSTQAAVAENAKRIADLQKTERCPTCGAWVETIFEHVDIECEAL